MARLLPPAATPLCAPPRPFGLPESLPSAGSQHLYPPPGHEKEPLAAPPAGLQMAPCGCFFDPRIYHIEWAATNFLQPPVYKLSGGGAAPLGTFVLEAQPYLPATGHPEPFTPYSQLPGGGSQYMAPYVVPEDGAAPGALSGEGARPAAPLLLALPPLALGEPPLHGFSHIEGRLKPLAASGLPAAPAPAEFPGCHPVVRGPPQAPGTNSSLGPAGRGPPAELPEQVLLEDAMKLFDCSLAGELGREDAGGGTRRGQRPGAESFFLREEAARDFGSLWLPEELLSSDYSVPEILSAVLSMDYFYAVKVGPEEPGWDMGLEPPLDAQERWLETEGKRSLLRAARLPEEQE